MVRNDIKNSSLLKTKFLIYAFNGRTLFNAHFVLFSPIFNGEKGFVYTVYCVYLCFSPCIQQHFALRFAAFHLAFSTKTHCI